MEHVIKIVSELVENRYITVYQVAKETGIASNVIAKMLNGTTKQPSIKSLKLLQEYLDNNFENEENAKQNKTNNVDCSEYEEENKDLRKKIVQLSEEIIRCKDNLIQLMQSNTDK